MRPLRAHSNRNNGGMGYRDEATIKRVLTAHTWAVVGLTNHEWRAAYGVARFLQQHGKRIVPVNPAAEPVHGEPGYATLADIPFEVDVVESGARLSYLASRGGTHVILTDREVALSVLDASSEKMKLPAVTFPWHKFSKLRRSMAEP